MKLLILLQMLLFIGILSYVFTESFGNWGIQSHQVSFSF